MGIPNHLEILKMPVLILYRNIIKNMRYYPSKNRFNLLLASKEGKLIIIIKKNLDKIEI